MKIWKSVVAIAMMQFVTISIAHEAHTKNVSSSLALSFAFDHQGRLWRASVTDGFILVDKSLDHGKHFSDKVKVNQQPQNIAAKGEARPKIAIGPQGNIYLTWTQGLKKRFTGYVWFARSTNGGQSFEQPIVVHQDRAAITHRFDALSVSSNGKITVAWVDKRDLVAAKKAHQPYTGAAIYYAVSTDDGATFKPERKLADSSCECCRIATTVKPDGTTVAFWRHVFEGSQRDHMIAEIPKPGEAPMLTRATFGRWQLDGCPHHGGAIASGGDGPSWWGYHIAYFDGKDKKPGLYYTRIDGKAWATVPAKQFGDNAKQARHPVLMNKGKQVWLAWLETTPDRMQTVMIKHSTDEGKNWSAETLILQEKGKIDYPQLLKDKDTVYLAVNTASGLKVMPLH